MGTINHDTIIVTSWNEKNLKEAHNKAIELFGNLVSNVVDGVRNQYTSFFIAPDGSKEKWPESDKYDKLRNQFIDYINSLAYGDGSNSIDYIAISYGEYGSKIIDTNCNIH